MFGAIDKLLDWLKILTPAKIDRIIDLIKLIIAVIEILKELSGNPTTEDKKR